MAMTEQQKKDRATARAITRERARREQIKNIMRREIYDKQRRLNGILERITILESYTQEAIPLMEKSRRGKILQAERDFSNRLSWGLYEYKQRYKEEFGKEYWED